MKDQAARERHLALLRRQLAEAIDYRNKNGREYSPGEIDEIRQAIEYMTEQGVR